MPGAGEQHQQRQRAISIRTTARQASRLIDFEPGKSARSVEVTIGVEQAEALLAVADADPDTARAAGIEEPLRALRSALATRADPATTRPLTPREREVLQALSRGDSYAEIARDLHLDVETVRTHARGLRRKLGVASSRELRGRLDPQIVI